MPEHWIDKQTVRIKSGDDIKAAGFLFKAEKSDVARGFERWLELEPGTVFLLSIPTVIGLAVGFAKGVPLMIGVGLLAGMVLLVSFLFRKDVRAERYEMLGAVFRVDGDIFLVSHPKLIPDLGFDEWQRSDLMRFKLTDIVNIEAEPSGFRLDQTGQCWTVAASMRSGERWYISRTLSSDLARVVRTQLQLAYSDVVASPLYDPKS